MTPEQVEKIGKDVAAACKVLVQRATEPLLARIAELEKLSPVTGPRGEKGEPGESVHPAEVRLMVTEEIAKSVAALPPAKNGIDGKDAADIDVIEIRPGRSYPRGTWATAHGGLLMATRVTDQIPDDEQHIDWDALGWKVVANGICNSEIGFSEDTRTMSVNLRYTRGAQSFRCVIPQILYRGVWQDGEYMTGDTATWDGSVWYCKRKTTDKPGTSDAWQLMVKRGAAGKNGGEKPTQAHKPAKIK